MKKLILLIFVFLIVPSVYALVEDYNYTGFNFNITPDIVGENVQDIYFNGTYFYVLDKIGDSVYQYDLSGTYMGFNFNVSNEAVSPEGIAFNGSSFFIVDVATSSLYEYNLSGNFTEFNFSVLGQGETNPTGVAFNGSSFFIVGVDTTSVLEYDLSGGYIGTNVEFSSQEGNPTGVAFNGSSFFVTGSSPTGGTPYRLFEFNLSGGIGINSNISSLDLSIHSGNPAGLTIYNDLIYILMESTGSTMIYEYANGDIFSNIIYNTSNLVETSLQHFSMELHYNKVNTNAILIYNGSTSYYDTKTTYSDFTMFNYSFNIPFITSNETSYSYPFYFDFNYTINEPRTAQSETFTQTAYQMILTNCTDETTKNITLHSTLRNETDLTNMTGDISATHSIWISNPALFRNFSFTMNGTDFMDVCIYPEWATYYTDAIYDYTAIDHIKRFYNLVNTSISNATQDIFFYLLGTALSSNVLITVTDLNDDPVADANIKIKRFYPSTGNYETIELIKTDHNGEALAHLVLYDILYKFSVEKDGFVLWENPSAVGIYRTTLSIQIDTGNTWLERFDKIKSIQYGLTFDNSTKQFSFTYSDTSNVVQKGCLKVTQTGILNEELLTESCEESTGTTITYTITGSNITGHYLAEAYILTGSDNLRTLLATKEADYNEFFKIFDTAGVIVTILFIGELAALFSFSPPVALIGGLLGLIGGVIIGFVYFTFSTIMLLVIIIAFAIAKMRR